MPEGPATTRAWDGAALTAAFEVPVVVHGTVSSTMTAAAQDSRTPAIHLAERQTAGEGRRGRTWESPPGNLYATIAWEADAAGPATLAAMQVAWAERVAGAGGPATLCKWPNDGLVGDGKWAGLLARQAGGRILVGLGANLERAPRKLGEAAAALADHWRPWPGREAVGRWLLEAALEVLRAGPEGAASLLARWPLHDAFVPGEPLLVETQGGERRGAYGGVAPDGQLRLTVGGTELRLAAGDVTRVRPRPRLS